MFPQHSDPTRHSCGLTIFVLKFSVNIEAVSQAGENFIDTELGEVGKAAGEKTFSLVYCAALPRMPTSHIP